MDENNPADVANVCAVYPWSADDDAKEEIRRRFDELKEIAKRHDIPVLMVAISDVVGVGSYSYYLAHCPPMRTPPHIRAIAAMLSMDRLGIASIMGCSMTAFKVYKEHQTREDALRKGNARGEGLH